MIIQQRNIDLDGPKILFFFPDTKTSSSSKDPLNGTDQNGFSFVIL